MLPTPSSSSAYKKHLNARLQVLASRESLRIIAREVSCLRVVPTARTQAAKLLRYDIKPEVVEHYSIAVGVNKKNHANNRYLNIIPYDRTRVTVRWPLTDAEVDTTEGERYLNANWVLECQGKKWWIATQAPLPQTAHAFLSLILQPNVCPLPALLSSHSDNVQATTTTSRVRTVVQLTQNIEDGRRKADFYFPSDVGTSFLIPPEDGCDAPPLKVTLLAKKSIKHAHCIQSTISIVPISHPPQRIVEGATRRNDYKNASVSEGIIFQHLLYLSWPDHGLPDITSLLSFVQLVDSTNRDISSCTIHPGSSPDHPCTELDLDPPIMVGCSAGVGRTGTFIALSSVLRASGLLPPASRPTPSSVLPASPLGPLPDDAVSNDMVTQEIDSLREQRPGMLQSPEQAALVYMVLADVEASKRDSE